MRAGRTFDSALDRLPADLPDPDRRLAHEVAAGVLRGRRRIDAALAPLVARGWERTGEAVRDVLRIGAYQLLELGRVPAYAAVDAAVELAKQTVGAKSAGFINAVLRRLASTAPPVPTGLGERYSHPDWLVERWLAAFGPERTEALLAHNNRRAALVLQPVGWPADRLRAALGAAEVLHEDAPWGTGIVVETGDVRRLPGYGEGAFVVQDAAQAHLLAQAAIADESRVWDACAAPGGKAARLAPRCRVFASESRQSRIPKLRDTLRRVASAVTLAVADARQPPVRPERFDVVLVDTPCSATGTMARHPDARWRLDADRLARLVQLQREILDGVASAVRPGGRLVYLTCSLEPEENRDQVNVFLERHSEFAREADDEFVFPTDRATDGGYLARLRRS